MGRIVIVAYRAKPGRLAALKRLIKDHVPTLRQLGLATSRGAIVMTAADGSIVEVFEWESAAAIERAHSNAKVQEMWAAFGDACEYTPIGSLAEARNLFAEFDAA
jgi:hypothetical protein